MKVVAAIVLLLGFAGASVAEQNDELQTWMKAAGQSAGVLGKLQSKTGKDAVNAAERLGVIYENMINYWRQRGAADAVKLAMAGKAASVQLASAARAGNDAEAVDEFKAVMATCRPCHDAHREKIGENQYRVK